jgi:hypothetical protein
MRPGGALHPPRKMRNDRSHKELGPAFEGNALSINRLSLQTPQDIGVSLGKM